MSKGSISPYTSESSLERPAQSDEKWLVFESKWEVGSEEKRKNRRKKNSSCKNKTNTQVKANKNTEFSKHSDLKRGLKSCGTFTEGAK